MVGTDNPIPLVSVVMPAYNHELYVGAAIESVLNQSYGNFEFIIVNDGSTDQTGQIIKKFKDSRITYFEQENSDAYNAINFGLSKIRGELVAIINSDDVFHVDRLTKLVEIAKQCDKKFVFTDLQVIDNAAQPLANEQHPLILFHRHLKETYARDKSLVSTLFCGNLAMSTSNFFFRREVINEIGFLKPLRYAHDYDFLFRVQHHYPAGIAFLPEVLLFYRVHEANTVRENPARVEIETYQVLKEYLPQFIACREDLNVIKAFVEQLSRMDFILQDTDDIMRKVYDSFSWKITSPLRIVGEKCGLEKPGRSSAMARLWKFIRLALGKNQGKEPKS